MSKPIRTLILGAAGRDFHNFNVVYRGDPATRVVAFTATQIPGIAGRRYPAELAGPLYPEGIGIEDEAELERICARERVQRVVFAYSDVRHETVMHLASRALAAGADFVLLGPESTMLASRKPVIAVSAIRTGCGKSQVSRWIASRLRARGVRVAVVRHPMPYGDLVAQRAQRFASRADLDEAACTTEEREEYEPHIAAGAVVYAGVDYEAILRQAEEEADVVIWDGGNNDFPFYRPDLHIIVADALRPGQATHYHPGEAVLRMADVVVLNKVNAASPGQVDEAVQEIEGVVPGVPIVRAVSAVTLEAPEAVRGKRVIVVDDGPTLTHGGMAFGAGFVAARDAGASQIVDPRLHAAPAIKTVFAANPHLSLVLPAMGYSTEQLEALAATIYDSDAEVVVSGTPADIAALVEIRKPVVRARYDFVDGDQPKLASFVDEFLASCGL